jgi:S-adenosylmethionine decarboxylase proenzyme
MIERSRAVGLHILSELYECKGILTYDKQALSSKISQFVRDCRLTEIGSHYHEFEGGGITAIVALAESHIALHTWPEIAYATLEVFVCNYTQDNSGAAHQVHDAIVKLLAPTRLETRALER